MLSCFCSAELPALCAGARRRVRTGGVQAAEVHRRGDGPQLRARAAGPGLLPQLQEGLGAAFQDLPGFCLGSQQILRQLQRRADRNRARGHQQR